MIRNQIPGGIGVFSSLTASAPTTQTGDYTVLPGDFTIIVNAGATATLTLPSVVTFVGRVLLIKTIAAFTVVSNASNVIPLIGGGAGTAILAATAGRWAILQSNGTNWVIMAGN